MPRNRIVADQRTWRLPPRGVTSPIIARTIAAAGRRQIVGIRPWIASAFAALLALSGLATGYVGLSANGFLVPAAVMLLLGGLVWFGAGLRTVAAIVALNLACGSLLDLVLALGESLGTHKLDVAGVLLLANIATGGPLVSLLAVPLLAALWFSSSFRTWLAANARHD